MSITYFTHCHGPSLPHVKCLMSSIRRFDEESRIIVVVDNPATEKLVEWSLLRFPGRTSVITMSLAEEECRKTGIDWGRFRGQVSERDLSWRMQAALPWLFLQDCNTDFLCYWDSDTYWFAPFYPVIKEFPETAHVGICPHHFPIGRENQSAGRFNNGAVLWRNSDISREHSRRWALETLERWKPGHPKEVAHEQKLLDEWPEQLGEACVELPWGTDYGPWQNLVCWNGRVHESWSDGRGAGGGRNAILQSHHFHEFRRGRGLNPVTIKGQEWNRSGYLLHEDTIESVYKPYETELAKYL